MAQKSLLGKTRKKYVCGMYMLCSKDFCGINFLRMVKYYLCIVYKYWEILFAASIFHVWGKKAKFAKST